VLVSENYGDLIFTREFASYLQKRKFSIYMCKKADPESKGRIEKVVDFVKDNFASNRIFSGIDKWNEDCIKWLERRGNGKTHNTTKKIPAEVFNDERKYLQPVTEKLISEYRILSITYQVRKDNTVPIKGNRYTVPIGTYKGPYTYVGVKQVANNHLIIYDIETKKELAKHDIPDTKGNLVRNNNHKRSRNQKIAPWMDKITEMFSDTQNAKMFLDAIHKDKPRYMRDQLMLIEKALKAADEAAVDKALKFCVNNNLNSKGREKKKFERMLKLACFPEYKTLDEFNLEEQITLSKKQFNQLKELSWLEKGFNLIFLGAPGVGKSHISVGIGIEALNNGYKVRFITMADLIHLLKTQEISSRSKNNIKRIISSDLVIIDDLMFMAMEKGTANMFFQLINKLYGQTSLIITSNKGPEDWGELIGDPAITTAILDRLIHKCEIINIHDNESYRMKHREKIFKE
jgi:DNA replication protein DnaC